MNNIVLIVVLFSRNGPDYDLPLQNIKNVDCNQRVDSEITREWTLPAYFAGKGLDLQKC